jgi:hypothetical protein
MTNPVVSIGTIAPIGSDGTGHPTTGRGTSWTWSSIPSAGGWLKARGAARSAASRNRGSEATVLVPEARGFRT